ncbi:Alcohol dehydrogenase YqhD [Listeria fleischmannii subsp. fleischmannii]|uniref:Alcohol dehydrogenase YqhD n=1 Tax=Listeria fleischmannii subsp. fleischmannii TaxID=1671902 RepID=A0A2X3IZS2_9LIST|nr:Alcohol dehydrogenase YqhD [Listeria fleischmannii subsp. fleischmannii]
MLAVGGGSVIDGTKFVAAAARFLGDPLDIFGNGVGASKPVKEALPFGTVLTLPATGSEMNSGAVVTIKSKKAKVSFGRPVTFPVFSILDPELTYTLPERQLANGVIDSFVHIMEQYLTYPVGAMVQDRYAEGLLQTLIEIGPSVVDEKIMIIIYALILCGQRLMR